MSDRQGLVGDIFYRTHYASLGTIYFILHTAAPPENSTISPMGLAFPNKGDMAPFPHLVLPLLPKDFSPGVFKPSPDFMWGSKTKLGGPLSGPQFKSPAIPINIKSYYTDTGTTLHARFTRFDKECKLGKLLDIGNRRPKCAERMTKICCPVRAFFFC